MLRIFRFSNRTKHKIVRPEYQTKESEIRNKNNKTKSKIFK